MVVLGPGDFRSDETLERRFGEFEHSKNLLGIPRTFLARPGTHGSLYGPIGPYLGPYIGPNIGPYLGPYFGPLRAQAYFRRVLTPEVQKDATPDHSSGKPTGHNVNHRSTLGQ